MKITVSVKYVIYALHLLIWVGLFLLPYLVSSSANGYSIGVIPGALFSAAVPVHMGIFYTNAFFLYPKLFNKRRWWLYILSSALLLVVSFKLKFYIIAAWFPRLFDDRIIHRFIFIPSVVVFVISLIYCRITGSRRTEREQRERESIRLATELKFLRSQISPHFLFNVLTNLVSLARKKSDKLEQSLIMLSGLMRYTLHDTQGKKVELGKEVEYLESYIELQKLRFGNDVKIECTIRLSGDESRYTIEPMLLIPFVENAFKHGTTALKQPYIFVKLIVHDGYLIFEVLNNFNDEIASGKDESSGIGIGNVKARLNMIYKDNYILKINNNNGLFYVTLTLKII
ncbi:MAG TPA: sensor histidine kinase [Mucilaginibacter sp.]|nr:sensor histidine kinase [Mucilaginibacter sp.]